MIILPPTTISSLTADSANASYPAANLLRESPKRIWRADSDAVTSATLTWTVTGPVDTVVLHHAVAATVTLEYYTGASWASPPGLDAAYYDDPLFPTYTTHWLTFTALTGSVQLRLTLTQSGTSTIRAANLLAGSAVAVEGVIYPLQEGLLDTSIRTPLLNGEEYYLKRDVARMFSGSALADRGVTVRALMLDVARRHGSRPLPVQLAPPWGDDFFVYGRLSMPQASHAWPTYSSVSFELREMVGI
jgi:hypothetical protein